MVLLVWLAVSVGASQRWLAFSGGSRCFWCLIVCDSHSFFSHRPFCYISNYARCTLPHKFSVRRPNSTKVHRHVSSYVMYIWAKFHRNWISGCRVIAKIQRALYFLTQNSSSHSGDQKSSALNFLQLLDNRWSDCDETLLKCTSHNLISV